MDGLVGCRPFVSDDVTIVDRSSVIDNPSDDWMEGRDPHVNVSFKSCLVGAYKVLESLNSVLGSSIALALANSASFGDELIQRRVVEVTLTTGPAKCLLQHGSDGAFLIAPVDDLSVAGFLDESCESGNDMIVNAFLITYDGAYRLGWIESGNEHRGEIFIQ